MKCLEQAVKFAVEGKKALEIVAVVREINDRGFGKAPITSFVDLEGNVTSQPGTSIKDAERLIAEITGSSEIKSDSCA